jgi:alpha-ketoglutarate-dependent taurine dioxygenase
MNAAAAETPLTTVELTPLIGTEIRSDADTLLSGRHAAQIREELETRGVLIFREIGFTNAQQLAFAQTIGEVMLQGGKDVLNISLDPEKNRHKPELADYFKGAWYWHIDQTTEDTPSRATLLIARKLSETGGETEFANTYAAWDALPDDEKRQYDGLRVVHSLEVSQRYVRPEPGYEELKGWQSYPTKTHPLVWTHRSGRKSLVLGSTASHVEGMGLEEGRLLLTKLREWATQPRFVYRHSWTLGDMLIWDNTGTMHRATPYPIDSGRNMSRVTLVGEEQLV